MKYFTAIILTLSFILPINGVSAFSGSIRNMVTQKQEVIDTITFWGVKRNVYSIPVWKYEILKTIFSNEEQMLHYHIINNLECGAEFGDCINQWDVGPFQLNNIHKDEYKYSAILLDEKKFAELYKFQLEWTKARLELYKKSTCKDTPEDLKLPDEVRLKATFGCMLVIHNGNNKNLIDDWRMKEKYRLIGLNMKDVMIRHIEKVEANKQKLLQVPVKKSKKK